MARAVILLFLIVAVTTISAYPRTQCGENEIFTNCGSSCQPTCEKPTPSVCTLACVIGCECAQGYIRNAQQQCVLTQNC